MKAEDTESIGRKGVERVTAALVNDNLNRYSPTVMDGVMVNTYKALNNIFLQDLQNARIEFNRAADRQRRAEETFKTRIAEQQEKMAALEQQAPPDGGQATMIDLAKSRQASENAIFENFPELKQWQATRISSTPTQTTSMGSTSCWPTPTGRITARRATPCAAWRA